MKPSKIIINPSSIDDIDSIPEFGWRDGMPALFADDAENFDLFIAEEPFQFILMDKKGLLVAIIKIEVSVKNGIKEDCHVPTTESGFEPDVMIVEAFIGLISLLVLAVAFLLRAIHIYVIKPGIKTLTLFMTQTHRSTDAPIGRNTSQGTSSQTIIHNHNHYY